MSFPPGLPGLLRLPCLFFLAVSACARATQSSPKSASSRSTATSLPSSTRTARRVTGRSTARRRRGAIRSVLRARRSASSRYRDVAAGEADCAATAARGRCRRGCRRRADGEFAGARRLTDAQIALLQQWAEQGAPEGDPASKPPLPELPKGWQLGQPDLRRSGAARVHRARGRRRSLPQFFAVSRRR